MLVSDDDVLNATLSTLKVLENSQHNSNMRSLSGYQNNVNLDNKYESSESSAVVLSSASELSENDLRHSLSNVLERNISYSCPKNYLEFQSVLESLEVMNMMHDCYHEKKSLQKQNETNMQSIIDVYADIMLPSNIREKVKKMKIVLDHITSISKEGAKLRQVLRSNVLNDFWKINVDYHRCVVNFFSLAQEITKDIHEFISCIEQSMEHNPDRSKNLHILETKLLAELHENLDILTEFQSYVQTKLDLSS